LRDLFVGKPRWVSCRGFFVGLISWLLDELGLWDFREFLRLCFREDIYEVAKIQEVRKICDFL